MQMVLAGEGDISEVMENLRKTEISTAGEELAKSLPSIGRCPICTLKLPCTHYSDQSELQRQRAASRLSDDARQGSTKTTPLAAKRSCSTHLSDFSVPGIPVTDSRERTVRYRGKNGSYAVSRAGETEQKSANRSFNTEDRLQVMEKLEAYKIEKLRRELKQLEDRKEKERQEREAARRKEEQRVRYLQHQKQKLKEYHEQREKQHSKVPHAPRPRTVKAKPSGTEAISFYDHKRDYIMHLLKHQEKDIDMLRCFPKHHDALDSL